MSNILKTLAAGSASEPTDEYFNQTTLLLHGDGNQGANNFSNAGPSSYLAFSDNSDNDFPITVNGDAYGSPFSPYSLSDGNWSNYFDGTGDYLSVPDATAFTLGTSDFCMESWVYPTNVGTGSSESILGQWSAGSYGWIFQYRSNALLMYYSTDGSSTTNAINASATVVNNTFNHIAFVRSGNTLSAYVNGVRVSTNASFTASIVNSSSTINVGRNGDNSEYVTGYLSNTRLVVGSSVYDPTQTTLTVPTTALTNITNTSLLTCQSNRFVDNSSNGFAITPNGNVAVKTLNPFNATVDGTTGSGYFDGSGDGLTIPDDDAFNIGSSTFTLEFWLYKYNTNTFQHAIGQRDSGDAEWRAVLDYDNPGGVDTFSPGYFGIEWGAGKSTWDAGIQNETWQHIALVRNGTTGTLYVNGISKGDVTLNNIGDYSASIYIGSWSGGSNYYFKGYLSDLRLVKGTAVYTSNFTPPTTTLTNVTGTSLLTCQYQGTVRNVGFIDSSPNNFPITRNGNTTQGTFSPFSVAAGEWSNYFNGVTASQEALTATQTAIGTGNFTYEFWFNISSNGSNQNLIDNANGVLIYYENSSGTIILYDRISATSISSGVISLNKWHHCAGVREGTGSNQTKLYIDGVLQNSGTFSSDLTGTGLVIGARYAVSGGSWFGAKGYISNFRISDSARYTSAFTPSTTPLTADGNTLILTCQSNRFVDTDSTPLTITVVGNPKVTPFSPFAPSAAYSPSVNGGSGYFDGTGDTLVSPTDSALGFGTSNFCVEFWFNAAGASQPAAQRITGNASGGSWGSNKWTIGVNSNNIFVQIYNFTTTSFTITTSTNVLSAQWNHIVLSRSGSDFGLFVNGTRVGTYSSANSIDGGGSQNIAIGGNGLSGETIAGYIADFRTVIGSSVYTPTSTTLTVPTAPLSAITNTKILCNFTNAGIFDNTGKNNLETVGNAQVDTSVVKYGTGSMKFDGTGDWLLSANGLNKEFGAGPFTIECWAYITNNSIRKYIVSAGVDTASHYNFALELGSAGKVNMWASSNGTSWDLVTSDTSEGIGTDTIPLNQWNHIAMVRESNGTFKSYLNGSLQCTVSGKTAAIVSQPTQPLNVGRSAYLGSFGNFNGFIDDLRITKGVARYTSNFTVPDKAFPNQ